MEKHPLIRRGVAAVLVGSGLTMLAPALAGASVASQRHQLEMQLTARLTQLSRLSKDVSSASALTAAHSAFLNGEISAATTSMNELIARVPTDNSSAQVKTDQRTMATQNRVYAVLTPQIFQTIGADTINSQIASYRANETTLQADVNALSGEHGYKTALSHYVAYVRYVNTAGRDANSIITKVLAQKPAMYPKDASVFGAANNMLLSANESLAQANYLSTLVGLESGGFAG